VIVSEPTLNVIIASFAITTAVVSTQHFSFASKDEVRNDYSACGAYEYADQNGVDCLDDGEVYGQGAG